MPARQATWPAPSSAEGADQAARSAVPLEVARETAESPQPRGQNDSPYGVCTVTPVTVALPLVGVTSVPPSLSDSNPDTVSVFEKLHTNASNVQL